MQWCMPWFKVVALDFESNGLWKVDGCLVRVNFSVWMTLPSESLWFFTGRFTYG